MNEIIRFEPTDADKAEALNQLRLALQVEEPKAPKVEGPTFRTDPRAFIAGLPDGFRGLYSLVWFCRENQMSSTALRLRAFLASLYNGTAARKVDLSDCQHFDGARRAAFAEVLLHLGAGTSGLYDHHIREAFRACGIEPYFDRAFPRRRS